MGKIEKPILSPSEYYRLRRPEYFSDSQTRDETILSKAVLSYEISLISTNQKQDEFESLCRRLAEIFICPNLIPQVGPTGGGDGKTDTETYPVSKKITLRWFVPENGWKENEKWAFAISSKKDWKSKINADIKSILSTNRQYTRIYFFTNQTPSSKQKKDKQDILIKELKIEVIIIDGEWIVEKIFSNKLIELAVNALNLSSTDITKKQVTGENDARRKKELEKIETDISNTKRYFNVDYQLAEDTITAAVLTRMLEKPRDEVEGKFARALRICNELNNSKQLIRLHYQMAWTYLNWYDDYRLFIDEYMYVKDSIKADSSMSEVELYCNLFNLLVGIFNSKKIDLYEYKIDIEKERTEILFILSKIENNNVKPCSALIAKTQKVFIELMYALQKNENVDIHLNILIECMNKSISYMDYPFESFKDIIEEIGVVFPKNKKYDELLDIIASIAETRNTELTSGEIFLRRGGQKYQAELYKEAIIYFGKAVYKLAKDETRRGLYLTFLGLSESFSNLGLPWASYTSLIAAASISFRKWYETGKITQDILNCVYMLLTKELILGRIPNILLWNELFEIVKKQLNNESKTDISDEQLIDGCLSVRIINTENEYTNLSKLPDCLKKHDLMHSFCTCMYKLGQIDLLDKEGFTVDNKEENDYDAYFELVANQPFREQMLFKTAFQSEEYLYVHSILIGCELTIKFKKGKSILLIAETIISFLENYFATSVSDIYPKCGTISIELCEINKSGDLIIEQIESNIYKINIDPLFFISNRTKDIRKKMFGFVSIILTKNYIVKNIDEYLNRIFKNEEISERLSFSFEHELFITNIVGKEPKILFSDWIDEKKDSTYAMKRNGPILFPSKVKKSDDDTSFDIERIGHNQIKIESVIDVDLWDKAKWTGFGFLLYMDLLGIVIAFRDGETGDNIFRNWIERYGEIDHEEKLRISIIKGINKLHPYWYRVIISPSIDIDNFDDKRIIFSTSRIHEMNADNPNNLLTLLSKYDKNKKYYLMPASILSNNSIDPHYKYRILKHNLFVFEAWKIGINDIETVAIYPDDNPVLPENVDVIPILDVLKQKKMVVDK